jgi:putative oxidoreductase
MIFQSNIMKKFLFSTNPFWLSNGVGLIRIVVGLFLIYHGSEVFDAAKVKEYSTWESFKNLASPSSMVYLGKGAELVAGCLLLTGFLTRIACFIVIGTLGYITFFIGHGKIWYDDQYPFLFVLLAFLFIFTGPGNWSLDKLVFKNKA